jgi:integrase
MILFYFMLDSNLKVLEDYFALRTVSQGTKRIYTQALETWDNYTNTPIHKVDKKALTKWFKTANQELMPATLEKYAQQLRSFYAFTLEEIGLTKRRAKSEAAEVFDIIPFTDLRTRAKKSTKLRDKVVTPTEFQALMNATNNIRLKALMAITYESGCRKGEIHSIRLKDVSMNQDHWTLTVEGKTGTRTVPIIKSIPYLRAWLQIHPDRGNENQWLFVRSNNGRLKKLSPMGFNNSLRYLCEKVGMRHIYPHMLRHTRMTELAEHGLGEFQLKSMAGWTADSKMAAKYVHLSGRGHVNAVLETEGVDTGNGSNGFESKPILVLSNCPNCDRAIDPEMIQCPYCSFILDGKLGASLQDRVKELEAKVANMEKILEAIYRDTKPIQ